MDFSLSEEDDDVAYGGRKRFHTTNDDKDIELSSEDSQSSTDSIDLDDEDTSDGDRSIVGVSFPSRTTQNSRRNEGRIMDRLESAHITRLQTEIILKGLSSHTFDLKQQESIFENVLVENHRYFTWPQYKALLGAVILCSVWNDSIKRLLQLYLDAKNVRARSTWLHHVNSFTYSCVCPKKGYELNFRDLLWQRYDLETLICAIQEHGFNFCRLAQAIGFKSCDMVRWFLERRGILDSSFLSSHSQPSY